jgi:hypothetical protein
MSFERAVVGGGIAGEPGMPPGDPSAAVGPGAPGVEPGAGGIPPSMRLQILSTEHWSLLASRSLAWNESFSRASMFLTTLSGAIVALALVAQATEFGEGSLLTALVILPVVLFVGVATVIRMGDSNYHDAICVIGMNRIRHAYLELAPDLEPYFVMGSHDDMRGVSMTMGMPPGHRSLLHVLAATPAVISVVSSVLAAVIVALVALQMGAGTPIVLTVGILGFVVSMALFTRYGARNIRRGQASMRTVFPTPVDRNPTAGSRG